MEYRKMAEIQGLETLQEEGEESYLDEKTRDGKKYYFVHHQKKIVAIQRFHCQRGF